MLRIDCLLTEQDLARDLQACLKAGRLPEKFFYWFPLSVRAWLDLCSDGAYRNYVRSLRLLERSAADAVNRAFGAGDSVEVVSLGSGQGDKDCLVLRALGEARSRPSYRPVDSSQSLLEMAVAGAAEAGFDSRGVKADLDRPEHRAALESGAETPPRLYLLLGNTLGAFDPVEFLAALGSLLRDGDRLLVDGEFEAADTLAGYDNPLNRRFALAPLAALGVKESDGELIFETLEDRRIAGLLYLGKFFHATREIRLAVAGEEVILARGSRLPMNPSAKYAAGAFEALLEQSGLVTERRYESEDDRFFLVLAGRRP